MRVQLAYPGATPQQIEAHFRSVFPRYSVTSRAGTLIVGDGAATGVMLKPSGPGGVTLAWAFPNMAVQMLLTLAIVLTGILPGLVLFGITWLVVRSGVERLKGEVATVLSGGAPPVQAALPVGNAITAPPSPLGFAASMVAFAIALFSIFARSGPGAMLFWVAAGVAGLMMHFDQKRAFETRTAAKGVGRMVLAIAAILHGLLTLVFAFSISDDFFLARSLFSAVFYLGAGVVLVLAHTGKLSSEKLFVPQLVAGAVLVLFGLLGSYDLIDMLDRFDLDVFAVALAARSLAWIALGGLVVARTLMARSVPMSQPLPA